MKKFIVVLMIVAFCFTMTGCAGSRDVDGSYVQPYGLIDKDVHKRQNISYEISVGNVILSIIFCETIFVPIILVGWYLYEPVGKIDPNADIGQEGVGY